MTDVEDDAPTARPCYPITTRAMTDAEIAAAREFADSVARIDQGGTVFRHLCLLLGDHDWRNPKR